MIQTTALDILKTGKNVFLTGPAGSGKTFVLNQYIAYLKEHRVPVGITASTGIAATHMGGVTIHSWAGIGVRDDLTEYDIEQIAEKSYVRKRIEETQVLIIDEVSMLHGFRLDLVERVVRYIKSTRKNAQSFADAELPFGGMQVVLCGDFFQLPPITRQSFADRQSGFLGDDIQFMEDGQEMTQFVYGSDAWKAGDFTICYLSEQFRQKDDVSISILNEIRSGQVSEKSHALLKTRFTSVLTAEQIAQTTIEPTRLYTHNINVDQVNDTALGKVPGPEYQYEMKMKGKPMLVDMLKKSCLAPEILRLRKGARVMCVKNNFEQGYVNGTLGVVVSCGPGVAPVIAVVPSREYPDGRKITIEQATWKIEDDGKVLAEITQYPLRLAWAITVHKSQGMSLDAVEVDLSRSFEPGMGYVALSRVRTLAGLRIIGMNTTALEVHAGVLEYDGVLQSRSGHAEKEHEHTNQDRLIEAQKKFLARVASQHKIRSEKQPTIEITAELIGKRKTLKAIAKERNLTEDTVLDHVERLIEGGYEIDISYMKKDISYAHFCKIQDAFAELVEGSEEDSDDGNGEGAESSRPLPLLSPIKSKVGANISFKEIRLARILLGYVKAKLENI